MKTRLAAMAAVISTLSLLTACSGGSTGTFGSSTSTPTPAPPPAPPPTPAPTVTVTAPATATVGYAFTIEWSSTDATSCAADFDTADTGPTASYSATETTAGTKTYSVTCTGAGGDATGTATVVVDGRPTAEGAWQGTTDDDRAIAGVVTHPDATAQVSPFFLTYSQAGNHAVPAGFIAGGGTSTDTTPTDGSFASGSATNALREFNFEGDGAAGGSLTATYTGKTSFDGSFQSTSLAATWSFSGQQTSFVIPPVLAHTITLDHFAPDPITFTDGGQAWSIDTATPAFSGAVVFDPYVEELLFAGLASKPLTFTYQTRTLAFGPNTWSGTGTPVANTVTYDASTRTLTWSGRYTETNTPAAQCDDPSNVGVCSVFLTMPTAGTVILTFDDASLTTYHGTATWLSATIPVVGQAPLATMSFTGSVPSTPSVTHTYTSTYKATYETVPSLADIQGNYTGSAGIDVAMGSGSFDVAPDGSVSGTSGTCAYDGTVAPEIVGNVYDVTLTFSDNGGSCVYSGAFSGVATYDAAAQQVDVTILNATRDQGFLFSGTKP